MASPNNPNRNSQSTITRSFSASLNDAFSINNSNTKDLEGLAQSVEQKKASLSTQSAELEALETRLRETEEKLRQKTSRTGSPVRRAAGGGKEGLARAEGTGQENQSPRLNVAQQQTGPSRWEGLLPQQR